MTTSEKGLTLIELFEGLRLEAYKPVKTEKYYTIGYGHYGADVKPGMKITVEQARAYLKKDVKSAEKAVEKYAPYGINQNQFDALVSFTYNCGAGNLRTLCANRNIEQIGNSIKKYNKAGGKVLNGLIRRRKAETDLYFS